MGSTSSVTTNSSIAALHERYSPYAVPAEVVRVAEVEAEVRSPSSFGSHCVPDIPEAVFNAARRVIRAAGIRAAPLGGGLVTKRGDPFFDPKRELERFAEAVAEAQGRNVDPLPVTKPGKQSKIDPFAAPADGPATPTADPAARRRRLHAPFEQQDPPKKAPEIGADETNEPIEGKDTRPVTSEPQSGRHLTTREPEREADYRKALHDTARQQLSANALLAGLVICQRCWSTGELYASQSTLAEWMHIANTKTVRKAVSELEEARFLTRVGTKANRIYHYRLTIPCS